MKVYRYMEARWAIESIKQRRLKISRIDDLNDPFEMLGCDRSNPTVRLAAGLTRSGLTRRLGVLCFSRSYANPLLWSHYADKHRGICLGFAVPDEAAADVRYLSEPHPIEWDYNRNSVTNADVLAESLFLSKFEGWRYEDEVRVFATLNDSDNGLFFADFGTQLLLEQVILGVRCREDRKNIEALAMEFTPSVQVHQGRLALDRFAIVFGEEAEVSSRGG